VKILSKKDIAKIENLRKLNIKGAKWCKKCRYIVNSKIMLGDDGICIHCHHKNVVRKTKQKRVRKIEKEDISFEEYEQRLLKEEREQKEFRLRFDEGKI
jgi:hypothetical protein